MLITSCLALRSLAVPYYKACTLTRLRYEAITKHVMHYEYLSRNELRNEACNATVQCSPLHLKSIFCKYTHLQPHSLELVSAGEH